MTISDVSHVHSNTNIIIYFSIMKTDIKVLIL